MSVIKANGAGETPSGIYKGVVTTSLRFDKASGAYLYRTPSSGSNRRTFTISFWYKTSQVFQTEANDQNNPIFYADEPSGGGLFALNYSGQGQGAATDTENELTYYDYDSADTADYSLESNTAFNDPSAWYHVVAAFDTTDATEANRVKYYVNGVQLDYTSMNQHHAAVVQNRQLTMNDTHPHWIGRNVNTTSRYMNGYLAEFNFVDGTQYAASDFGEFKNGIWIAKEPNVTYGTNGFRLQFKNTGVGTASSSTIGADTSGNNNHFTSGGIAANDCAKLDCPENNFPTLSPNELVVHNAPGTLSEGATKFTFINANVNSNFTFNATQTGKYYWEALYVSTTGNNYLAVTLAKGHQRLPNTFSTDLTLNTGGGINLYLDNGNTYKEGVAATGTGGAIAAGSIIQFKLDLDNQTIQFGVNNSYITALDLPSSEGGWKAGGVQSGGTGATRVVMYNWGTDSSFAGAKTAQGNSDANGIGDFYYAVPSGFLAPCTFNLPEPTIGPNSTSQATDYMSTVLYTGNGSSSSATQDISGVGFQPDWLWTKRRDADASHNVRDSVRGPLKHLQTDGTGTEDTESDAGVTAFLADGFRLKGTNAGSGQVNANNGTYVAWNWKAGGDIGDVSGNFIKDGVAFTPTQGTIDATAISVNTTAAFSIVKFTSDISSEAAEDGTPPTIAHGIGIKPAFVIVKDLDGGSYPHWNVWHQGNQPDKTYLNYQLFLQLTNASNNQGWHRADTGFTTNLFTPPAYQYNETGKTYIAYCFAEVEGYSKFGSYTGNVADNGTFVHLGFKPAWIMIKCASDTSDFTSWVIYDNVRKTINRPTDGDTSNPLYANKTAKEGERGNGTTDISGNAMSVDFLSNGIKLRDNASELNQEDTFVYMAFAEQPFKYANAE